MAEVDDEEGVADPVECRAAAAVDDEEGVADPVECRAAAAVDNTNTVAGKGSSDQLLYSYGVGLLCITPTTRQAGQIRTCWCVQGRAAHVPVRRHVSGAAGIPVIHLYQWCCLHPLTPCFIYNGTDIIHRHTRAPARLHGSSLLAFRWIPGRSPVGVVYKLRITKPSLRVKQRRPVRHAVIRQRHTNGGGFSVGLAHAKKNSQEKVSRTSWGVS